ncbi:basic salivary proline-rich protein 4-like [Mus caroli]|uniref:Basic salivary proline-rich protein 4-like n=1 Tax=Mus caroli TaxID=10089 RepID=A0A6P5QSA2_MUSCR|nr:basic salivary proline-rich protein 4-like [Mus caroli]
MSGLSLTCLCSLYLQSASTSWEHVKGLEGLTGQRPQPRGSAAPCPSSNRSHAPPPAPNRPDGEHSWNDRLGRGPISLLGSGGPRRPLAPLGQPQQRLSGGVRESDSTAQGDRYPKVGGRAGPSQNRPVLRDRPHLPPHLPHLRAPPPALACGTPRHLAAHLRPARPGPSPRPPARAAPCAQPALGAARRPRAAAARAIAPPPLGGHNGAAAALLMHMHDAAPPAPPPRPEQQSPERCSRSSGRGECGPAWPG